MITYEIIIYVKVNSVYTFRVSNPVISFLLPFSKRSFRSEFFHSRVDPFWKGFFVQGSKQSFKKVPSL